MMGRQGEPSAALSFLLGSDAYQPCISRDLCRAPNILGVFGYTRADLPKSLNDDIAAAMKEFSGAGSVVDRLCAKAEIRPIKKG